MNNTTIPFNQKRDFGQVFNTTMEFIQQEIKQLGMALLYYVVPIVLLGAIVMVYFSMEYRNFLGDLQQNTMSYGSNPFRMLSSMMGAYTLLLLAFIAVSVVLQATVFGYFKLYIEKGKGGFTLQDIRAQIGRTFLPILGASLVQILFTLIGAVFCILPGIYLGVVLSLLVPVLVIEEKGFSHAFSRSFELIKSNWWLTFGLLLVAGMIVQSIAFILGIPAMAMGFKSLFVNMQNPENLKNFSFPTIFYAYSAITHLITYTLMAFPYCILAVHLFSLKEEKNKISLEDKIEQITNHA